MDHTTTINAEQPSSEQPSSEQPSGEKPSSEKPFPTAVHINQIEGTEPQMPKTYDNWHEANAYVYRARRGAGIGYNKVKFTVFMSDGSSYSGRYDVQEDEWTCDLRRHIRDHLEAVAADPKARQRELAAEWLRTYDFKHMRPAQVDAAESDTTDVEGSG